MLPKRRPDCAGDLIARRKLVDEALAVRANKRCPFATDCLADQETFTAGDIDHGGRVKLNEFKVGDGGPSGLRQRDPDPDRAWWVGRPLPERGGAAGGDHRSASSNGKAVLANDANDTTTLCP